MSNQNTLNEKNSKTSSRAFWLTIFAMGNCGYDLIYQFESSYGNFFLTDVCNISATLIGTMFTILYTVKVFFAPATGVVIDKKPFKVFKDKYTPWLTIGSVVLSALFILLAFIAYTSNGNPKPFVIISIYFVFQLCGAFLVNGLKGAIPAISRNGDEGSFLAAAINVWSNIGRYIVGIAGPVLMVKCSLDGINEDARGFFIATLVVCIAGVATYMLSSIGLKKTIRPDALEAEAETETKEKAPSVFQLLKQAFSSRDIVIPFIMASFMTIRVFTLNPLAPYYYKYVQENMMGTAVYSTTINTLAIVGVVLCPIAQKLIKDSKKICIICLSACIISHICLLVVGENEMGFLVAQGAGQLFYSIASTTVLVMFINAADYMELKERKSGKKNVATGTAISLHYTAVMVAQVFASTIRNFLLSVIGYTGADTVVTEAFKSNLIKMFAITPGVFMCIALIACLFYRLDKKTMDQVSVELEALRAEATQQ